MDNKKKPGRFFPFIFGICAVGVLLLGFSDTTSAWMVFDYILPIKKSLIQDTSWRSLGKVPGAEDECTPQGLTYIRDRLVLAESCHDKTGYLYLIIPMADGYQVERRLDLPPEAVHTSGLDWDGSRLWAVDYVSNRLYKIDWDKSLVKGVVIVEDSVATGLDGSGSLARLQYGGREMLAVTDFLHTSRTYLVPLDNIFGPGSVPDKSAGSYRNGHFNQGAMFHGGFIYETNNHIGSDFIFKIDPVAAVKANSYKAGLKSVFVGPHKMIEDIATDGRRCWTADESSYELYVTTDIDLD